MKTNNNSKLTALFEYITEKSEPYVGVVWEGTSSALTWFVVNATKPLALSAVACAFYSTLKKPVMEHFKKEEGEGVGSKANDPMALLRAISKSCKKHQNEILEAGVAVAAYLVYSKSETPLIKNTAAMVSVVLSVHQVAASIASSR